MAERELSILLRLKDQASKELANFQTKLKGMEPNFKKMAVAGTAAFAGISALAIKAIGDYGEVEQANTQLAHAVLQVSKGTKEQLAAIQDVISATEKKGVVDADALKVGVAQLSTFGLTTEMVKRLTPALADLAVNQNGVNVSGDQMSDTANTIAKALNGQFGVLEKSGIRFTESQQHMIQFGTETERTSALIEGFNQNLKFTNETALETTNGKLAVLKRELGNISEGIGQALAPALLELVAKVQPVIMKVAEWVEQNPKLAAGILAGAAALAGLVAIIGTVGIILPGIITAFTAVGTVIGAISLPILAIIALIGVIVAVIAWWVINWQENVETMKWAWQGFKDYFVGIWESIKSYFTDVWAGMKIIFQESIDFIMKKIQPLLNAIAKVKEGLGSVGGKVSGAVKSFGKAIGVNDAIISPNGNIITTHPDDYLIATKDPHSLAGAGGGINIVIYGDVTGQELIDKVKKALTLDIKRQISI